MVGEEILVIGGGLAGISTAYYLSKDYDIFLIESNSYFGGYFIEDSYKGIGWSGKELVNKYLSYLDKGNVKKSVLSTGTKLSDSVYILKPREIFSWNKLTIAATGFRCKTSAELEIYGNRPAGVYCVNTVMEMLRDGYIPGEKPIIYGLNRYTISLANKLLDIPDIKSLNVVSGDSHYAPANFLEFMRNNDIDYIEGRINWLDSHSRVSKVKLDNGREIKGDSLIIGMLTPFNYLNLNYSVGNASMVIMNPLKIIELSRIFAENIIDILNGGEVIKLPENLLISPSNVSRNFRKVMIGYPKGTEIMINDKTIVLKEDYKIIKLPDSDKIVVKVIR